VDLQLLAAHCGSLCLDPASLAQQWHSLLLLEALFREPARLPSVLPEHVTRPPLRLA
jgi:protein arginine N-methyltransferase 7